MLGTSAAELANREADSTGKTRLGKKSRHRVPPPPDVRGDKPGVLDGDQPDYQVDRFCQRRDQAAFTRPSRSLEDPMDAWGALPMIRRSSSSSNTRRIVNCLANLSSKAWLDRKSSIT